jgi:uncharacterized protein (DUF433 family)
MVTTALDRHIEIDPEIAGGKPRIAGHRITVQDVVIWHEPGMAYLTQRSKDAKKKVEKRR